MNNTLLIAGDRLKLSVAGALAMACFMGFGRFSFTPILPGMMADLGLTASNAGWIAAANFAGYLAGALLASAGWASGRERSVAMSALVATSLLLAAMALGSSMGWFMLVRFLAGLASAFGLVFTSSLVLGAAPGDARVQAFHFGGVGFGIALSAVVSFALVASAAGIGDTWRMEWLAGAGIVLIAALLVMKLLPGLERSAAIDVVEPALNWNAPMLRITVSYALFGFGYVVAATFLVAIARANASGHAIEFLCWLVTGFAGMVSLFVWGPLLKRFGVNPVYRVCLAVEAIGSIAMVLLPASIAPMLGGVLFGGTFIVVTAYALTIGRALSPQSPRRVIGLMTAGFGIGQIVGPVVAGFLVDHTGSFLAASLFAAAMLALGALIAPARPLN